MIGGKKKNKSPKKRVTLVILDGWGQAVSWGGNAISEARTRNFDWAWRKFPHTTLKASGKYVGLPGHEMGNSEVGHLTMGAGRIIPQDVSRINQAIENGSFFDNKIFQKAMRKVKDNNSKLHLMGLLSDGGVHSHIDHLFALLKLAKEKDVKEVWVHAFLDGRDTPPRSAHMFLEDLKDKMSDLGIGKIATISGRYYAMDRNNHWKRTKKAYQAMVSGRGKHVKDSMKAVSEYYKKGITDQYINPTIIRQEGVVEAKDSVIFFNFRSDRARQITSFFLDPDLEFKREKFLDDIMFTTIVPYYSYDLGLPTLFNAFKPKKIEKPLAKIISEKGWSQFHTAETEKYAHVTYFFNGGREDAFEKEDRALIPSPKVDTYDLKPEMSAKKVADRVLKAQKKQYPFILVNFANPDMVGHTGNLKATIKAVEVVDKQLGRILENRGEDEIIMVTADHGNAEEMIDRRTGKKHTEHTNNPVPFILIDSGKHQLKKGESIAGIAPAVLAELDLKPPEEMTDEYIYQV